MDSDSTLIQNTRRQVILDRHRHVISDMESTISDGFIDGSIQNMRLKAMLKELEEDSEQNRIRATLRNLFQDSQSQDLPLQQALIDYLCLVRDRHDIGIANLQLHAIGLYRHLNRRIHEQRGWQPELEDIRNLPVKDVRHINETRLPAFGSRDMTAEMLCPHTMQQRTVACIADLRICDAKGTWRDDTRPEQVPRDLTDALTGLSESERNRRITAALADRVRHDFFQDVFLRYCAMDEFDPEQHQGQHTILDWLLHIRETPQLYPFMQGQSPEQKRFRLSQLTTKILQISELYQRCDAAAASGQFDEAFTVSNTRQRLHILAAAKYPPLTVDDAFVTASFQYPLLAFVQWLQDRIASGDFVLPPEHRRR